MKMNKFLLLTGACLLALGMQAQPKMSIKDARVNTTPIAMGSYSLSKAGLSKASEVKQNAETPVTEAPAGRLLNYMYVTSKAYGMGLGDIYTQNVDGGLGAVVEGTDGHIWVKAPISQAYIWSLGNPWLKCDKASGDTIVMTLPQVYAIDAGDPYYAYRMVPNASGDSFVPDSVSKTVRFTWHGDTLTQIDDCLIGLGDADGEWYYMGDYNIQYTVNPDKAEILPTGIDPDFMTLRMDYIADAAKLDSTTSKNINWWVMDDGASAVYFDHIAPNLPKSLVKGVPNEKTISVVVPTRQYLGVDLMYNAHLYALAANAKVEKDSKDNAYFNYDLADNLSLKIKDIDNDDSPMEAAYPASLLVNCGRNNLYIVTEYVAPKLTEIANNAMTPADPVFTADDVKHLTNFDKLTFTIPTVDVNGKELNTSLLYYNVYYNDKPYVFTPTLYSGLTENLTDVPFNFTESNYDFKGSKNGVQTVDFYDKGWQKIGVQSIYLGNYKRSTSNIVWVTNTNGIGDVTDAAKVVKRINCYDLTGRQVPESASGLIIKRIDYTDGTTRTLKVIK